MYFSNLLHIPLHSLEFNLIHWYKKYFFYVFFSLLKFLWNFFISWIFINSPKFLIISWKSIEFPELTLILIKLMENFGSFVLFPIHFNLVWIYEFILKSFKFSWNSYKFHGNVFNSKNISYYINAYSLLLGNFHHFLRWKCHFFK